MLSAKRQLRSWRVWQQVSSWPRRPESVPCPLWLTAPMRASGASPPCRERCGVAESQLGLGSHVLLPRGRPQAGGSGPAGHRAHPALTLQGPGAPSSRALRSERCADVNGGTFGTACHPQRAAEAGESQSLGICAPAQPQLQAFLYAQRFRGMASARPPVMADSLGGPRLGRLCSRERFFCLVSNFARILIALPR